MPVVRPGSGPQQLPEQGMTDYSKSIFSRREALLAAGTMAAGAALGIVPSGPAHAAAVTPPAGGRKGGTVPLNWNEVFFTNCRMVSANNIDQELGWCKTDFKKIGVDYSYFRSRRENDWYPHYLHNLDNIIRFGGLFPPIQVNADIRRTRLLGARWSTRAAA